ncbi:MAG TPA: HPr-rel-A system PqqD family peptide chaperone [Longimicrobium sp.]|nr:HPr-rel-A system PqqD family peptide chaperone [Longimicrobium sp.]
MYRRKAQVIETELGGELILLDPATGEMFSLNPTARHVWAALPAASADELARQVAEAFEVDAAEAQADVAALLEELAGAGLIEVAPGEG